MKKAASFLLLLLKKVVFQVLCWVAETVAVQEDGSQLLDSIVGCSSMEDIYIVFPAHLSEDYLLHTCH